jgi:hypothetical protein
MKLKIIIAFVLILGVGVGAYKHFTGGEDLLYDFVVVQKGEIIQRVSARGPSPQ